MTLRDTACSEKIELVSEISCPRDCPTIVLALVFVPEVLLPNSKCDLRAQNDEKSLGIA